MSLVVVPAAAALLPGMAGTLDSDTQTGVDGVRAAIDEALERLEAAQVVVIAVAAPLSQILAPASADLASYGHPQRARSVTTDETVARRLAEASGLTGTFDAALSGDAAVLALQLGNEARAALPVVVVELDVSGATPDLDFLASILGDDCALLAAGDLASGRDATSPGYEISGATAWDDQAMTALRDLDLARWDALGPGEAERVGARGWAPLRLALQFARHRDASWGALAHTGVFGVGQVVGWAR